MRSDWNSSEAPLLGGKTFLQTACRARDFFTICLMYHCQQIVIVVALMRKSILKRNKVTYCSFKLQRFENPLWESSLEEKRKGESWQSFMTFYMLWTPHNSMFVLISDNIYANLSRQICNPDKRTALPRVQQRVS